MEMTALSVMEKCGQTSAPSFPAQNENMDGGGSEEAKMTPTNPSEPRERPELRSACCDAPVQIVYEPRDRTGSLHRQKRVGYYVCEECTNYCALRDTDPEPREI